MLEQLHRYTHEIINALSVRKVFSAVLVRRILNSWLSEAQQQKLTFDKGRAWMPEVERPKFCRTQNKQSVHKARVLTIFKG